MCLIESFLGPFTAPSFPETCKYSQFAYFNLKTAIYITINAK